MNNTLFDDNASEIDANASLHSISSSDISLDGQQVTNITIPPIGSIQEIRNYLIALNITPEGANEGNVTLLDVYNYAYLRGFGDGSAVGDSFASSNGVFEPLTLADLNTSNISNEIDNALVINESSISEGRTDLDMSLSFPLDNSFQGGKRRRKTKKSRKSNKSNKKTHKKK